MNEGTFKNYINRKISRVVHRQSMTYGSLSANGTPDMYYDGPGAVLWVEYKYIPHMPRDGLVGGVDDKKRGCYSTKQFQWMERRHHRGRNVLGIVGLPNRTAVIQYTPGEWKEKSSVERAIPWGEVARHIEEYCRGSA